MILDSWLLASSELHSSDSHTEAGTLRYAFADPDVAVALVRTVDEVIATAWGDRNLGNMR